MTKPTATREESPLELLLEDSRKEFEQVQRELKEIDILIQQSTGEVEKLARRHARATNHLRHIQTNLATVPRDDIREAYDAVHDVQQRLFTMRGQLEKSLWSAGIAIRSSKSPTMGGWHSSGRSRTTQQETGPMLKSRLWRHGGTAFIAHPERTERGKLYRRHSVVINFCLFHIYLGECGCFYNGNRRRSRIHDI